MKVYIRRINKNVIDNKKFFGLYTLKIDWWEMKMNLLKKKTDVMSGQNKFF